MKIRDRIRAIWEAAQGKNTDAASAMSAGTAYKIDDSIDWSTGVYTPRGITSLQEASWHSVEFDQPNAGQSAERQGMPVFDLLREWNWQQRIDIITRCHQVWERNPLARAAVNLTRQFSVSTGVTVSTRAVEVKEVIDTFMRESSANVIDKGMCDSLQLDGEVFVRLFSKGGKTALRFVKPWDVQEIVTETDDTQTVTDYRLSDGKTVPAKDMVHVKINSLPYEQRGRPELVAVLPWLKAYKDWLEDRFRQNRRRSVVFDVTLKNATPAQVTAKRGQLREPPPPGSIVVHNENEVWQAVAQNINAGDVADDGKAFKVMVAVGVGLPEYMLSSGDSNLATATAQALPALTKFKDFQDVMKEMWLAVLKSVVEHAIDAGLITEDVIQVDSEGDPVLDKDKKPKTIKALDAFDVQYPALTESDPLNLAQALQIDVANGWCANGTAAAKRGYDPMVEKKKVAEEQAEAQELQQKQMDAQAKADAKAAAENPPPDQNPQNPGQVANPPQGQEQPPQETAGGNPQLLQVKGNKAEKVKESDGLVEGDRSFPLTVLVSKTKGE